MPEFVSRSWGWFQARSGVQKAIIAVVVLLVLAVLSPAIAALAGLLFFVALGALVVQLIRRRPVRPWAIAAGGALVVALAFGGLSSALLSGPEAEGPPRVEKAKKPQPEKPPKPPTNGEQASKPEPKAEDKPTKEPEGPPEYSVEDVYIDKGGGPGSAAALQVLAPDVERGEQVARLAAADYAQHDYVIMDLYASKAMQDDSDSYASATVAFNERGAKQTGLDIGEMSYDRNK